MSRSSKSMRVGPRCPGGVAEAVADGAPGIPAAVGAAGSKAARTASDAGGGFVAAGAGVAFLVEAVALEDFLAELDLLELLLALALELLLEDLVVLEEDLPVLLLEVEGLAVLLEDLAGGLVSSVAARTFAGSAMQQAIVDRSATTRRTVRLRMGTASANRTGCAPVNASEVWNPLANPCVAGCSMCGGVVVREPTPGVTEASCRPRSRHLVPGRKSFRTACGHPRNPRRRRRTSRNSRG